MEGVMDATSEQLKERWIVQAIDEGAIEGAKNARDESMEGAVDATCDRSGNN
jgi:hypothetical protein